MRRGLLGGMKKQEYSFIDGQDLTDLMKEASRLSKKGWRVVNVIFREVNTHTGLFYEAIIVRDV